MLLAFCLVSAHLLIVCLKRTAHVNIQEGPPQDEDDDDDDDEEDTKKKGVSFKI